MGHRLLWSCLPSYFANELQSAFILGLAGSRRGSLGVQLGSDQMFREDES